MIIHFPTYVDINNIYRCLYLYYLIVYIYIYQTVFHFSMPLDSLLTIYNFVWCTDGSKTDAGQDRKITLFYFWCALVYCYSISACNTVSVLPRAVWMLVSCQNIPDHASSLDLRRGGGEYQPPGQDILRGPDFEIQNM